MSAARGRTASPWPRVVAGASYVLTMVVLGTVATWPIYRTAWLLVVVAVAAVVGAVIAAAVTRRRLPWWVVVLALLGAVAVLGVPVTMPGRLSALDQLGGGFVELARGVALAWKDLLTVDLPVGDYRNLLVPVFVTFLVATTLALLAAWRADRRAVLAVPAAVAMPVFGLLFGRSVTSDPLVLGPVSVPAPIETFVGVATVVAALLWLAWRERDQRLRLLEAAAGASGIRARRLRTGFSGGRLALAAGMVVVAVVVTAAVVPFAALGVDREVLRSAVGPTIDLAAEPSPLSTYRSLFSDTQADQVLFQVTTTGTAPARVRLATLDVYDGEIYRAGSSGDGRFVRVPSSLDAGAGTAIDATVTIGGLSGIWLPTLGQVSSVDFQGSRAAALSDGFYYNADAQAGVDTVPNGLGAGDVYRVTGVDPITPDLATVRAPGGAATSVTLPDNLTKWVEVHQTGTGGEALSGLVALLRARGYLSHALSVSTGATPVWMAGLADYTFQPSAAGHSLARVDQLFAKLLQREADPQAAATDNYVAAVGDDEQFAVAVALIANKLGFPARVVLGARLSSADATVPVCVDGACRADDLSAWTEVRDDQGQWIAVDATPQHAQSPSLEVTRQRDPENVTEVRPDSVDEVAPPNPVQQDSDRQASSAGDSGWDLAWLWATLKIGGLVLLVLLVLGGPFLLVAGARFFRRRSRRLQADPAQKVAGGWDEYVDAAIDAGRARPASRTRRELAALYGTPSGTVLADGADEAVFSPRPPSAEEADAFWRIVDEERRGFAGGQGFWRKLATALSLRSFVRFAAPRFTRSSTRSGARAGSTGRGTRRTRRPAR